MTNQLIVKLGTLSVSVANHVAILVQAYEPRLKAAAEDLDHRLEAWTNAVDAWAEGHFEPELEHAREAAGVAYRLAVKEAHVLIDEVKARLAA